MSEFELTREDAERLLESLEIQSSGTYGDQYSIRFLGMRVVLPMLALERLCAAAGRQTLAVIYERKMQVFEFGVRPA